MSVHAFVHHAQREPTDDAAWALLRHHADARHYAPCLQAARALKVPTAFVGEADLVAAAAAAIAETFGLLEADRAAAARARVSAGLEGAADDVLARAGATAVLAWCIAAAEWCERNGRDHAFSRLTPRAAVADAAAAPWARVHWRIAAAWHHESFGRLRDVDPLLREAAALADAAGDVSLEVSVALARARLALSRSVPDDAQALASKAAMRADEASSPLWLADCADVFARAALMRGDMHCAVHEARRALGFAHAAAAVPAYTFTYRVYEGYGLLGLGAWDDAVALMDGLARSPSVPPFLARRLALMADLFSLVRDERRGPWDAAAVARLADALRRLRELDWSGVLAVLPSVISRLWARALDAGVEVEWVQASILARDLAPPEPAWPFAWPWAVRIRLLGPFACTAGGQDLTAGPGKAAAKPLALLKRVAAEGGYDGVAADRVATALWPGEGREGRDKALETTLARLRKLLGSADAVLLHERRLRLNPRRVWLDTEALSRCLDRPSSLTGDGAWADVLSLWRSTPLAGEPDAPWLAAWRLRWRRRVAAALAAASEAPGHHARCLRATAGDPDLAALL